MLDASTETICPIQMITKAANPTGRVFDLSMKFDPFSAG
jgi:hypothetical protein